RRARPARLLRLQHPSRVPPDRSHDRGPEPATRTLTSPADPVPTMIVASFGQIRPTSGHDHRRALEPYSVPPSMAAWSSSSSSLVTGPREAIARAPPSGITPIRPVRPAWPAPP